MANAYNPPIQSAVLNHLRTNRNRWITLKALADHIYGNDPNGGPLWYQHAMWHAVKRLRERGFTNIESRRLYGYRIVE